MPSNSIPVNMVASRNREILSPLDASTGWLVPDALGYPRARCCGVARLKAGHVEAASGPTWRSGSAPDDCAGQNRVAGARAARLDHTWVTGSPGRSVTCRTGPDEDVGFPLRHKVAPVVSEGGWS